MANANLFYTVKKGDTLGGIALSHGTTPEQLRKINGLDSDQIKEGQIIALSAKAVCKVTILVLDRDHNPIQGAKIRLDYNGKSKVFTSGACGIISSIITQSPNDVVKIYIWCIDGTWEMLKEVYYRPANTRVTVISKKTKHEGETMPHPKDPSGKPVRDPKNDKKPVKPPVNPEKTEKKSERKNDKNGLPVQKEAVDQVKFDFLGGYTGEKITEGDYKKAAKELGCEVEVIKAIGMQETAKLKALGLGSFDKFNRPTILYERHRFSENTNNKYDSTNPEISNPSPYLAGTARKKVVASNKGKARKKGEPYDDGKHYGLYAWQYKKLAKAYALNKEAAICSCSWGTFQVMGENYKACGFSSPFEFAKAMSKSELEHLKAMVAFCKARKLQSALKARNWIKIARTYNGKDYKKNKYDKHIKDYYEALKKKEI